MTTETDLDDNFDDQSSIDDRELTLQEIADIDEAVRGVIRGDLSNDPDLWRYQERLLYLESDMAAHPADVIKIWEALQRLDRWCADD